MIRAIFLTDQPCWIDRVYAADTRERLNRFYSFYPDVLGKKDLAAHADAAQNAEAIFSVWGMPSFTAQEIAAFFPDLKYIFYAAGSVQHFAAPFLKAGVRVFSAHAANAVPVAEYVFAQIVLSNKGAFRAARLCKSNRYAAHRFADESAGNYRPKIGIIGVGQIGGRVARLLRNIECEIFYYDPYLPSDKARELGIDPLPLDELFRVCDCVSNHLADKDELCGVLKYEHFAQMKPYATFINTGRGRQVDERGLAKALRECRTKTALLDVTAPEPPRLFSPLRRLPNAILTPHIAGSLSGEVARMGEFMCDAALSVAENAVPDYEITETMLSKMA